MSAASEQIEFDGPLLRGRWRLGPQLGEGGQGRTFLARDEQEGRVVVVKSFTLRGGNWKKFDLFEREVRVLRALSHPGIPGYLDSFESEPAGSFHLVMERAPGEPLDGRRFDEEGLRALLVKALVILAYLHQQQPAVIHRDVKPANLVLADDGRLWLVDFGGVRDAIRAGGGSTVVGTFGYMAPEQLHGQATPATDVYGLGATIVALAGGVEPEEVPRRGLRMDLKRHFGGGLSAWLVEVLERMTEPDPEARPQSAREVLKLVASTRAGGAGRGALVPAAPALKPELSPTQSDADAHHEQVEDAAEFVNDPSIAWPVRLLARVMFVALGTAGWVGLSVLQLTLVPLAYAIASAFVRGETQARLDETRGKVNGALSAGRRDFRALARGARTRAPRQLPPPKDRS